MTKEQFLLLKLSEECMEVAQRASKQIQFGKGEVQKGQPKTNQARLKDELLDLFAIVWMLQDEQEIAFIDAMERELAFDQKKEKLQKYLDYSTELGMLPEIKL